MSAAKDPAAKRAKFYATIEAKRQAREAAKAEAAKQEQSERLARRVAMHRRQRGIE